MFNGLVSLSFTRSGGFVAFGNPLAGEVTVTDTGATLRSETAPDGRLLTSAERAMLAGLDPARLRAWSAPETNLRDALTDTVTLRFGDGRAVTLTFTDPPGPTAPGAEALATWVRGEVEAIWRHRLRR